ncbi:MAG: 5'-deoxynucleotidase [Clostridia bacterium]|nr:5'-deoxynucleotidase [Clostridia bacterium]
MAEQFPFYAYLSRMKYISRWGLMRNTMTENIQEHSLQVAMLAHCLAILHNRLRSAEEPELNPERACVYGVFHDANEIITGDLPTPIKYFNPAIKENYHQIEDVSKEKLLSMLPKDLEGEYRGLFFYEDVDPAYYPIVKAADRLSAYIKCEEEVKAGNGEFVKAKESVLKSLQDMHLPALDYFMEHFMEAFSLTLDELN